jgi:acyl carrier protein
MRIKLIGADLDYTGQKDDDRSSLRNELRTLVTSWGLDLPSDLDDDASLITSGFFDSLALFNLILWVEQKIGRRLDQGMEFHRQHRSLCPSRAWLYRWWAIFTIEQGGAFGIDVGLPNPEI